ncbi:MAG: HEAT repeat domain-containing protein [Kiritimatiellia bacterium]
MPWIKRAPIVLSLVLSVVTFCSAQESKAPLPAFPDAEGFGAAATGGRGGRVIKVTNLNPTGPGSFQAALDTPGPRIVIFEVSGVIPASHHSQGKRYFTVSEPNLTIAGQTAPGAGITLDGTLSFLRGGGQPHNIIVRFLRIRTGSDHKECYLGRANIRGLEASPTKLLIVDHVSAAWSLDDCFDLYTVSDATIQWCSIEESDIVLEGGDEPHNFGLITGWASLGPRPITIHHTLIANHRERTPCVGSFPTDFRNNVIYNAASPTIFMFLDKSGKYRPEEYLLNLVGNYCKPGPGGLVGNRVYMPPVTIAHSPFDPGRSGRVFVSGNWLEGQGGYREPWKGRPNLVDREHSFPSVTTHTAEAAFELVTACAGCLPRDAVSARTIAEVFTGTGSWGRHGPAAGLMEGLTPSPAPPDTDEDGMPDEWENAHGLDPHDPADANKTVPAGASPGDRHCGYTFVEYYINDLADWLVAQAVTEARLARERPKSWQKPARELAQGAKVHASLDEMVRAISEQTSSHTPSTDTHAGWFAVQQLQRLGEEAVAAVPKLTALLESTDARTTNFAAWALGAIGPAGSEAVPALARVLERKSVTGSGKWVFSERGFAAWALGRMGTLAAPAVTQLAQVADGDDARAQIPALWALSRVGKAAAQVKGVILKYLDKDHAPEAIAQLGPSVVTDLVAILTRANKEKRLGALKALCLIGSEAGEATTALLQLVHDTDADVRTAAATALGRIGRTPEAAEALAMLLNNPELQVRHAAASALREMGTNAVSAVSTLERALNDQQKEVRRTAAMALASIGSPALPPLRRALASGDQFVRQCVAYALGTMGKAAADATGDLARVLTTDPDALCRREAIWALMRIGMQEADESIGKAAKDVDYVVRFAAKIALQQNP